MRLDATAADAKNAVKALPAPEPKLALPAPEQNRLFWSGFFPENGEKIAKQYAKENGLTSLEMTININRPDFSTNQKFWHQVSENWAKTADGDVTAILGNNVNWNTSIFANKELPLLLQNPNVTSITIQY